MNNELDCIERIKRWMRNDLPLGKETIQRKLVLKGYLGDLDRAARYNARLAAKRYVRNKILNYYEQVAPDLLFKVNSS